MQRHRGCFGFIESSPMSGDPPPPQWRVRFIWRRTVVQKDHTPSPWKCNGNVGIRKLGVLACMDLTPTPTATS
jgi:hypothetical protein